MSKEKVKFPWKWTASLVAVFALLLLGFTLWVPIKTKYYSFRLHAKNTEVRIWAVDGLVNMAEAGRNVLLEEVGRDKGALNMLVRRWSDVRERDVLDAITCGYTEVVELFLLKIPVSEIENNTEYNYAGDFFILHCAASCGNIEICRMLIDKGMDVNAENNMGLTPLHEAVKNGHIDVVRYLLSCGSDVTARSMKGKTPLRFALLNDRAAIAILLEENRDCGLIFTYNWTLLHYFSQSGSAKSVRYLVKAGYDLDAEDIFGHTSLYYALCAGNFETADVLIDAGADKECADIFGMTIAFWLLQSRKDESVLHILRKGADVHAKTDGGYTLLHEAVGFNCIKIVQYLLEKGLDVNARTGTGLSVLDMAKNVKMEKILKKYGAKAGCELRMNEK